MLFTDQPQKPTRNWARNVRFHPEQFLFPKSLRELITIVKDAYKKGRSIRVIGSGHSFTPVASCADVMISLDNLQGLIKVDREKEQATIWGGTKLYHLGTLLKEHNLALPNMGDIDQQSLAGALQTATHGTGATLTCLSALVTELTLLFPHGEVLVCNRQKNAEVFRMARVALGTFGVVISATIQCVPRFHLEDRRFVIPFFDGVAKLDELAANNRHFEFFYFPYTTELAAKSLNPTDAKKPRSRIGAFLNDHIMENTVYLGMCALGFRQPRLIKHLNKLSSKFAPKGSYADESFRVFPTVRKIRFTEMEYSVPRARGTACLQDIKELIEQKRLRIILPIEYRFVAKDDIPLSPFFGRDSVSISLHAYNGLDQEPLFRGAEEIFLRHSGRPHWGKIHYLTHQELKGRYSGLADFQKLRHVIDPKGILLTPYLRQLLVD